MLANVVRTISLWEMVLWRRAVSNAVEAMEPSTSRFSTLLGALWAEAGPILEASRCVEEDREVFEKYRLGRTVMGWMTLLHRKYEHTLCELLNGMGRVSYNFQDKQWICDAYGPLISSLASEIPIELDRLTPLQLLNAFYGLASLGPDVLKIHLRNPRQGQNMQEVMQAFVGRALDMASRLDGTQRCQLMEGMVLMDQRLEMEQIEHLLADAAPLLKSCRSSASVHPRCLTSLLWAMGKHGCSNQWSIAIVCLEELSDPRGFKRLSASDMGRAIWGLHQLKIQSGYEPFLRMVQRYFRFTVDVMRREMWNYEVVEFAEGLASMQFPQGNREVMAYLVRDVAQRRTPLTPTQRERFLTACRGIGYPIRAT